MEGGHGCDAENEEEALAGFHVELSGRVVSEVLRSIPRMSCTSWQLCLQSAVRHSLVINIGLTKLLGASCIEDFKHHLPSLW